MTASNAGDLLSLAASSATRPSPGKRSHSEFSRQQPPPPTPSSPLRRMRRVLNDCATNLLIAPTGAEKRGSHKGASAPFKICAAACARSVSKRRSPDVAIVVTDARTGGKLELCRVGTNPEPVAEGARRKTYTLGKRKPRLYSNVEVVKLAKSAS